MNMLNVKAFIFPSILFQILCLACLPLSAKSEILPVYQIQSGSAAYLEISLSHDVYRYSNNSSLNNLVVVDSQGNQLPYAIETSLPEKTLSNQIVEIPYYRVGVDAPEGGSASLDVTALSMDNKEVLIRLLADTRSSGSNSSAGFYLLDLREIHTALQAIKIDWTLSEENRYLPLILSGSNDLHYWDQLTQTTLAKLTKENGELTLDSIPLELSPGTYKFLRIQTVNDKSLPPIIAISGVNHFSQTNELWDEWSVAGLQAGNQLSVHQMQNDQANTRVQAWEYVRDEVAPVARISVDLKQQTYGNKLSIFSRAAPQQPWQLVAQPIWFNAKVGDIWQASGALSISTNAHRYWRIELQADVMLDKAPELILSRRPQVFHVIANNQPPYQVAIDTSGKINHRAIQAQILAQLTLNEVIDWMPVDFSRLNPPIAEPQELTGRQLVNWRALGFWVFLFAAVIVLVGLALKLVRQMK